MSSFHIRSAATLILLGATSLFVLAAHAEDAQAPVDAAVSDAGSTDANDEANADADAAAPPLPAFDAIAFPDEKSAKPTKDEWKTAQQVALTEGSNIGTSCKAYRLREWIRIRCDNTTTVQIVVRCGTPDDVSFALDPLPPDWGFFPEGGEVVFPVRRGDRRLIDWMGVSWGYKGANSARQEMVISEMWLPGDDKPILLAK